MDLGFNLLLRTTLKNEYTFRSLNEQVATVQASSDSSKGVITAVNYGRTSIEVIHIETGIKAQITVNVLREGAITNPKIVSGSEYTIALKADGTVFAWGRNIEGQLGLGNSVSPQREPVKIDISDVVDVAVRK
jgi:alpha-tubulin suppressor-like RCC1 family protein